MAWMYFLSYFQFTLCISQSRHKARGGAYASARRHRMVRRKDHRPPIDVKERAAKATRPYQHSLIEGQNLERCVELWRRHKEHVILPFRMLDYAYRYEYLPLHTFTYIWLIYTLLLTCVNQSWFTPWHFFAPSWTYWHVYAHISYI